jgi:polygalacturonase
MIKTGQAWYDENRNNSNQPGRPIAFTILNAKNLWMDGVTWSQAQFWHSFISHSQNVTMSNIYMNSTSDNEWFTVNTDGADTWNSRDVFFYNWTVQGGKFRKRYNRARTRVAQGHGLL